jgi:hypothetical protein
LALMLSRMRNLVGVTILWLLLMGCASTDSEGHPAGTIPYHIAIETSDPGSRIEVDGEYVGVAPVTVTIYGDKDGTFHGAGDGHTTFRAYPVKAGQFIQTKTFLNGAQAFMFGQQDRIPKRLFFDLNQKTEELQIIGPR